MGETFKYLSEQSPALFGVILYASPDQITKGLQDWMLLVRSLN